jgi:hypothetical protein
MSQKVWLGGIHLKEEGGYEVILRALSHYKKRLKLIGRSPELKDASMFAQIVLQEANKTGPLIEPLINKVKSALQNPESLNDLQNEIPLFEKALNCYYSDINKAKSNADKFYTELIPDIQMATSDLEKIKTALSKITQFL